MQEREAADADRERMRVELAERARNHELQDVRIRELENELTSVKAELGNEKQLRLRRLGRGRERQESLERDEAVLDQLGDITNLVQDQRDECERKKVSMEERFAEKEARREQKDMRMEDMYEWSPGWRTARRKQFVPRKIGWPMKAILVSFPLRISYCVF